MWSLEQEVSGALRWAGVGQRLSYSSPPPPPPPIMVKLGRVGRAAGRWGTAPQEAVVSVQSC